MTAARRIARHPPPRAGHARCTGARRANDRALAAATLGVVAGLALGLAILVDAPAVGGLRSAGPAGPMLTPARASVASVIAPAGAMAPLSARDREDGP